MFGGQKDRQTDRDKRKVLSSPPLLRRNEEEEGCVQESRSLSLLCQTLFYIKALSCLFTFFLLVCTEMKKKNRNEEKKTEMKSLLNATAKEDSWGVRCMLQKILVYFTSLKKPSGKNKSWATICKMTLLLLLSDLFFCNKVKLLVHEYLTSHYSIPL